MARAYVNVRVGADSKHTGLAELPRQLLTTNSRMRGGVRVAGKRSAGCLKRLGSVVRATLRLAEVGRLAAENLMKSYDASP